MNTRTLKTQKSKQAASAFAVQRKQKTAGAAIITDNRPATATHRSLHAAASSIPRINQGYIYPQQPGSTIQAHAGTGVVQRAIDDDLQALEEDYQNTDDPLLRRILGEIRLLSDVEFTSEHDPEEGHAERQERDDTRAHLINLDPRITDPVTRQSLILHELIHVSADRKYNVNQTGEPEPALTAVINPADEERDRIAEIGKQARYRGDLANRLSAVVDGDWVVDNTAADLVRSRSERIKGASHREFDSVVSELYYRLKKMGVDERSDTFKEVQSMAAGAYRSRNEGLPLDQTYQEPFKTGFFG